MRNIILKIAFESPILELLLTAVLVPIKNPESTAISILITMRRHDDDAKQRSGSCWNLS